MGQDRKYISVRLYTESIPEEVPQDTEAGTDIYYSKRDLGNSRFSIRAKSELFKSDRLFLSDYGRYSYISLLCQIVAVGIFLTAIWDNISNWKGIVLFVMGCFIGILAVIKLIWPDTMYVIRRAHINLISWVRNLW